MSSIPPEARDAGFIWDMLEAAKTAVKLTSGLSRDSYLRDSNLKLISERLLEIVGEAARMVSESYKAEHPEVPWRTIIAQRNVIAHNYGEINHERLWDVLKVHLPALIETLTRLVPPPPPDSDKIE